MKEKSYHENVVIKNETHLRELMSQMPPYCKQFFIGIEPTTSSRTRIAYAYDLLCFFCYLKDTNPLFKEIEITEFPITILDNLSPVDIEEYLFHLKYYEKDGIFYQREELFGGGMVCPWESYTIENIEVKGKECKFSVYATYPAEISPEGVSGACYNFLAIYEDEWKLAFIVSKSDCSVEETKEYLEEDRAYVGVDIDYENLITEKEALDIAYDYFYKDSNLEAYRVYCDKMPYFDSENNASVQNIEGIHYEENSGLGYVVAQYSGSNDIEIFDNTPSPEKDKICLTYLGKSENDAFYVFWLYSYISDGDGNYHYSTLDYILVTADGREVVCERCDVQGNYIEDVTAWKDFRKFLNCTILNSWIF